MPKTISTHNPIPYFIKVALVYCIAGLFSGLSSIAQNITIHHPKLQFLFEDSLIQNPSYHSALKPIEVSDAHFDSVMGTNRTLNLLLQHFPFRISPIIDNIGEYNLSQKDFFFRVGRGLYMAGNLGPKAGFELSATLYIQTYPKNTSNLMDSLSFVPGFNRYLWKNGQQAGYFDLRGSVYWNPMQWLGFRLGNDKHFIGDGYRSLLLSENAAAAPYFQTRLKVWKINYSSQVMFMRDLVPGSGSKRFTKYCSQHTLSFNATKTLNVYIFEAVIWRQQDSAQTRGFDLNYLNPFLFFRPVEYNMGSPDNVLMGIGGKWLIGKKTFLYGQLMLDEFRLKELQANKGWWGNKYAYQVGIKTYALFKNRKSQFLAEYNHCRPYTYSHTYSLQNYGYLLNALAHPLGANFREAIVQLNIAYPKLWFVTITGMFQRYGTDPPGIDYGGDIYKPQWAHPNNNGNYTGQGISNDVYMGSLSISKVLIPSWRMQGFINVVAAIKNTAGDKAFIPQLQFGINTLLYEY